MLKIATTAGLSGVHGTGLFAAEPIKAGSLLWSFDARGDSRVPIAELVDSRPVLEAGYVNPRRPAWVVICGDDARFWNFPPAGTSPNSIEGLIDASGEAVIVAERDIAAGEELLIEPASDMDYARKMQPQNTY